jgi:hypothetical protein
VKELNAFLLPDLKFNETINYRDKGREVESGG